MRERAWFIFEPRTADDLTFSNKNGKWMEYRIVKKLCLSIIDYENFSTDLLADRQFIEDNFAMCTEKGDCLLVTNRQNTGGILVIPWHERFVRYAATPPAVRIVQCSPQTNTLDV